MIRTTRLIHILTLSTVIGFLFVAQGGAIETTAKHAIVVDYDTGNVLLAKNADDRVGPASMTKMMTAYLVFERLRDGRLSLEDTLPVSEKAWRKGGSKMYVEVGKRVKVEDLIRGIIVQSGNDASIVVAEALDGTEDAFAIEMTEKAIALGMTGTSFQNSSGWPDSDHYTTVRDLATLAMATIRDFPDYYHYYAEKEFTFSKIRQGNRNPLLYKNIGADGLKTGHTEESGFGIAASALRDGRRVIVVAHGMGSMKERSAQTERLLGWAFREWGQYALFESGETVTDLPVWLGRADTVPVFIRDSLLVAVPRKSRRQMAVRVVHPEAIPAPVAKGDEIARLVVSAPGMEDVSVPLFAGAAVGERNFFGRLGTAIGQLVWGLAE
ncbi:MAG: D-alanyl-D-alanine carboxypeptidase [Alphaproteobacteria bacterium]|nr:D-alanyl-D-alanine carboxypeptidase [Alphaproteobacteria bacterium]